MRLGPVIGPWRIRPVWWKTEVIAVGTHERARGWETLYEGRDEAQARKVFTDIEVECATALRGHTELKLWHGDELRLHIWWHRGVQNK